LLRAPRGNFADKPIVGYEDWYYYDWTVAPEEQATEPQDIINALVEELKGKGYPDTPIILLHSIRYGTLQAITDPQYDMLTRLQEIGYTRFEKLPRLGLDRPGYPIIER